MRRWLACFAVGAASLSLGAATEIQLDVDRMVCPMCSGKVTETLAALDGVERAYVDLANSLAVVSVADEADLTSGDAAAAVEAVGFPVTAQRASDTSTEELIAALEKTLGQPLPSRPTSVAWNESLAPELARLTIVPQQWADWAEVVSESETPVTVLAAQTGPRWPRTWEGYTVYDWPAAQATLAVNPKHSLILLQR